VDRNIRIVQQLGTGLKPYPMMFKGVQEEEEEEEEERSYSQRVSAKENIKKI
jgi:hypothetical protein